MYWAGDGDIKNCIGIFLEVCANCWLAFVRVLDILLVFIDNICCFLSQLLFDSTCQNFPIIFKQFPHIITHNSQPVTLTINPKNQHQISRRMKNSENNKLFLLLLLIKSLYFINQYQHNTDCTMQTNKSNHTFDVENQAKNTLAYFSDYDCQYNCHDWENNVRLNTAKRRQLRLLQPIKNIKLDKNKAVNIQSFYRGRTALVPYKISLQNQQAKSKGKIKTSIIPKSPYQTIAKENYKPHKTIRNTYSLTRQAEQKEQEQGFDFMQYWIRHRFEDGAISTLVQKLKQKNTTIIRL